MCVWPFLISPLCVNGPYCHDDDFPELLGNGWLDQQTRAVVVSFVLYNANYNQNLQVLLDFHALRFCFLRSFWEVSFSLSRARFVWLWKIFIDRCILLWHRSRNENKLSVFTNKNNCVVCEQVKYVVEQTPAGEFLPYRAFLNIFRIFYFEFKPSVEILTFIIIVVFLTFFTSTEISQARSARALLFYFYF